MTPLAIARAIAALGVAFLLGSLPWALWIGRWARGVDVRAHGSGNLGATNVYRTLGPRLGWTVFALDLLKSAAAVFAADAIGGDTFPGGRAVARAAGALCAVLGHVFSPLAGWKGGKGVAAALGAMVAVAPLASLTAFGVFVLGLVASRRISVGSILAAIALPTLLWVAPFARAGTAAACVGTALAALVLVRHVPNMRRLAAGTEPAFAFKDRAREERP
jgi:glycerol-3-phosphate acyltransferase PlsY